MSKNINMLQIQVSHKDNNIWSPKFSAKETDYRQKYMMTVLLLEYCTVSWYVPGLSKNVANDF